MNRHLTTDEKKKLIAIIDSCGFPEVMRAIGQYVANEHPDLEIGTSLRSEICATANKIANAWKALAQP